MDDYKPPKLPDGDELDFRRLVDLAGRPGGLTPFESVRLADLGRRLEARRTLGEQLRNLPKHGPPG